MSLEKENPQKRVVWSYSLLVCCACISASICLLRRSESANCDTLSLKLNRELNLASSAPPFVQSIQRRVFEADFLLCQRLTQAVADKKGSTLMGVIGNQL